MKNDIENIINDYKKNKENAKKHISFINDVREYNGYIFKEINDYDKFENELNWLKRLMKLNYCTPKVIGTYNKNVIIMEKINGTAIKDEEAHKHLYNIGKLIASLHNLPVTQNIEWNKSIITEYIKLKEPVKNIMDNDIYENTTNFLEQQLDKIKSSKLTIIHKDIRPENIIYSNEKYYLLDLESMGIGDRDYDFTRILNLLNQKDIYQYKDFKNLIDGYKSVNNFEISEEKWQLYNKFYAFRIYSKMLSGNINTDKEYEEYLKSVLMNKHDRVTKWIKEYKK